MIDVIEKLKQLPGANLTEVSQKHTFECYRVRSDGCMQEVTVVILDAGPNTQGAPRYFGHATSAEGRIVAGRAGSSLEAVFESVRWSDLDPEPDGAEKTAAVTETADDMNPQRKLDEYDRRDLFGRIRKRLVRKP